MHSNQDRILSEIRTKGPILPAQIAKILNTNILIASAHLSELVDLKKIHYSHTKIGGSPVYYLKGQEPKLQQLSQYLNEKEKQAYSLLKEKKILKDIAQPPLIRVALRNIKDFAVPITVNHDNQKELFWKWYLLSNEEATEIIKSSLEKQKPKPGEIQRQQEQKKLNQETLSQGTIKQEPQLMTEQEKKKPSQEKKKTFIKEEPIVDPFLQQVQTYLNKKNIQILTYDIVKKKKEINLFIKVPSAIGQIDYFCIAKKKRKVSDSDLNSIYVQGKLKKKPVLFLTTGILSKKAASKLTAEFKEIIINKLE